MPKRRKLLSIALAFALIANILAIGATAVIGDGNELSVDVNLELGWQNGTTFTPLMPGEELQMGDVITVRICPTNDFWVGVTRYIVMYTKSMFKVVGNGKAAFTPNYDNPFYAEVASNYSGATGTSGAGVPTVGWPPAMLTDGTFDEYTAVAVSNNAATTSPNGGYPGIMNSGEWLFRFDLQVQQDITDASQARIWMDDEWLAGPSYINGAMYFAKCTGPDQLAALGSATLYQYEMDLTEADLTLPLAGEPSTITFDSAGGSAVDPLTGYVGNPVEGPADPTREGYTFTGWNPPLPSTYPSGGLSTTATWTANSYNAIFNVDGALYQTVPTDFGAQIAAPADPVKEGFTFTGWDPVPGTMGAADETFNAVFSINTYDAVFRVDGSVYSTVPAEYGAQIATPADPVKEGYTFTGWTPEVGVMPEGGASFDAVFTANTYDANFYVDGILYETVPTEFGAQIIAPADPVKTGYDFAGWDPAVGAMGAADQDFDATWTPASGITYTVNTYTQNTELSGYDLTDSQQYSGTTGETVNYEAPAVDGFTFDETASTVSGEIAADGSLVLSVYYTRNSYTISFYVDGSVYDSLTQAYGTVVAGPADPAKTGYTFTGWDPALPATMPAENFDVDAVFSANTYDASFYVDGALYEAVPTVFGETIAAPADPVKEGYTFTGWDPAPGTMGAADETFNAVFTLNTYNAIFNVDGALYETVPTDFGAQIAAPADPVKEGYTFTGWDPVPGTMGAADETFNAVFTVNTYNAIFNVDGALYETVPTDFGAQIAAPADPVKEGYTFTGWDPVPGTMGAADETFNAVFTVNTYNAIFNVDGALYETVPTDFGAQIAAPADPVKEGFTFTGWDPVPGTMGAADETFNALFTVNTYNAIFNVDGALYETVPTDFGAAIVPPADPVKEGYTFTGWDPVPGNMGAADETFNAVFTVNAYNAIFNVDGALYETVPTDFGAAIVPPADPVKEGYTFQGWTPEVGAMPEGGASFDAVFTANTYDANFYVDGILYETVPTEFGAQIIAPADPVKTGYDFAGWDPAVGAMGAADQDFDATWTPASGVTYTVNTYMQNTELSGYDLTNSQQYAGTTGETVTITPSAVEGFTFNEAGSTVSGEITADGSLVLSVYYTRNSYTISFYVDGSVYDSLTQAYGTVVAGPADPAKTGYTFTGWDPALPGTMPSADIDINAVFNANTYDAAFYVDGALYEAVPTVFGETIAAPADPVKEGYTFTGWDPAVGTMDTEGKNFDALFTVNTYNAIFNVDGALYETVPTDFGAQIAAPADPVKEGYTFTGWDPVPGMMGAADETFNAVFTVNTYDAIFNVDGALYETVPTDFGAQIAAPADPVKEGYTFTGWDPVPGTMGAADETFNALFTVNTYNAIFNVDGALYETVPTDFGAQIAAPADPVKEGFTFTGWDPVPGTMGAADETFNALFTVNTYNAIFNVDGALYETVPTDFGAQIAAPADPAKEGYTFTGWDPAPGTMGAADETFNALFTVNTYNAIFNVDGALYETVPTDFGAQIAAPADPVKEGFTFTGWDPIPGTMGAADETFNALFTVNTYNAIFNVDGTLYETVPTDFGAQIAAPADPVKEGYTFTGWDPAPGTMGAADETFNALFTVNTYNAIFNVDGALYETVPTDFGAQIAAPADPVKEGYTFTGWDPVPGTMGAADETFNAVFTVNDYIVTFYVDGAAYDTQSVSFGEAIPLPADPVKTGYTFTGWNPALPQTMPAANIDVYAEFTANTYDAVFMVDDEVYATVPTVFGEAIAAPDDPEKYGFYFAGWEPAVGLMDTEGKTFNATWSVNPGVAYTVNVWLADTAGTYGLETSNNYMAQVGDTVSAVIPSFDHFIYNAGASNSSGVQTEDGIVLNLYFDRVSYTIAFTVDGNAYDSITQVYGSVAAGPADPVKEGYTFDGWFDADDTQYTFPFDMTGDLELTAKFTVNTYNAIFNVDGALYETVPTDFGAQIAAPADPVKEGFTFTGWDPAPGTMGAADETFNALFTVNTYNAIFNVDGALYETVPTDFGAQIAAPADPVKEGYTFTGWDPVPGTMGSADETFNALFTVNTYDAIFNVDGALYETVPTDFGAQIAAPADPVKEGYTFTGWDPVPGTMGAADETFNALFTVNTYNAIFNVDGALYETVPTDFGAQIAAPADPVKEGFTFTGWEPMPGTMGAADETFNAVFTVNDYTVTFYVDGAAYDTQSVSFGEAIPLPADPVKTGYTFTGWNPALPQTMPAANIDVYAEFTANTYDAVFMVDDEVYATVPTVFGEAIAAPDDPEKYGFYFAGWEPAVGLMDTEGKTFNATWSVNPGVAYTVNVWLADTAGTYGLETSNNYMAQVGDTVSAVIPSFDHFIYNAGASNSSGVQTEDGIVLNLYFDRVSYTIAFTVDGNAYDSITQVYGSVAAGPADPVKEGYTFDGWFDADDTQYTFPFDMTGDLELTAKFTVNTYNAIFNVDGALYATVPTEFGAAIAPPADPVKEGFTFTGWDPVPGTMGAADETFNACFIDDPSDYSVIEVTLPVPYYGQLAPVAIKVTGRPMKLQFYRLCNSATVTFARGVDEQIISIQGYDAQDNPVSTLSSNLAYEIWIVNVRLAQDDYVVRARYYGAPFETVEESRPLSVVYDQYPTTFEVAESSVTLGSSVLFTVVTGPDVVKIQLFNALGNTITYDLSDGVHVDNTAEETRTWVIIRPSGWVGEYTWMLKTKVGKIWTDTGLSVTYTVDTIVDIDTTFTINNPTVPRGVAIVLTVTTAVDISKIQLVNALGGTVTYNMSYATFVKDEEAGTHTWTITVITGSPGHYTWSLKTKSGTVWTDTGLSVNCTVL